MHMFARDVEIEIAKLDYVTMSLLAMANSESQQVFNSRLDVIGNLRKVVKEVLNGDAFNPIILADRIQQEQARQNFDSDFLAKVGAFSEGGST